MRDKNNTCNNDLSYTLKDKILSRTSILRFKQELLNTEDVSLKKTTVYKNGYVGNKFLMIFSLLLLGSLTIWVTLLFLK